MIRKLIFILFFLFVLNFNFQHVYRVSVRYKSPVVFVIGTETDTYTSSLIEKRNKYYEREIVYLYISFQINETNPAIPFNSS